MSSKRNEQEQAPQDVQDVQDGAVQEQDVTEAPEAPEATQEAQGAYSVAALAERVGASQKDVRRWLRARVREAGRGDVLPGKGGRYAFDGATLDALARAYGATKGAKGTTAPGLLLASLFAPVAPEGEAPEA